MLALIRPALLVALSAQLPAASGLDESYCYASFLRLRFDILNYSQYPHYFNESTTLQLAETGVYTGISEIEEYVRTGAHPRHYTNFSTLSSQTAFKVEQDAPDLCVFLQVNTVQTWTHDLSFPGAKKRAAYMLKLYYDPAGEMITGINVYYPKGWLDLKYSVLLNTDAARSYVCDIMMRRCPVTWASNNLTTMEHCVSAMAGLDLMTPPTSADIGGYLDGRTQACRQLHAMMAEMNPDRHCAHISLVPQLDPKGKIKCQTSAQVQIRDIFDDADLATFRPGSVLRGGEREREGVRRARGLQLHVRLPDPALLLQPVVRVGPDVQGREGHVQGAGLLWWPGRWGGERRRHLRRGRLQAIQGCLQTPSLL